jgi:apolipoprotein D and lipocalin family protein
MKRLLLLLLFPIFGAGCAGTKPMPTVDYVDIDRFMGDWYVIASIPTFIEEGAHNGVESYALNEDGTIDTTFVFNQDGFDGERKEYNPKGFVREGTGNAIWGMQFVWPIKSDYRIVYLDDDYETTIIGRNKRDFVWIMSRSPAISEEQYAGLERVVENLGYDVSELRRVPQDPG